MRKVIFFAVDFKSSYYQDDKINGLTLGSYWGYFRNRDSVMNMDHAYNEYASHLVLGMLYKQSVIEENEKKIYHIEDLEAIHSVIEKFIFFVQPKWKIASDKPGSGNTRNIGGIASISKLLAGQGPFAPYGEDVFDDYWMGYFNKTDARQAGIGSPHYFNLDTYKQYVNNISEISKKL